MHESPRPKTAKENMDSFRRRYETEIQPLIDKGNFKLSYYELQTPLAYFNLHFSEILHTVHFGPTCLAALDLFSKALEKGEPEEIQTCREEFEAYLAQTALPLGD